MADNRYAVLELDVELLPEAAFLIANDPELEIAASLLGRGGKVRFLLKGDKLPDVCLRSRSPVRPPQVTLICVTETDGSNRTVRISEVVPAWST